MPKTYGKQKRRKTMKKQFSPTKKAYLEPSLEFILFAMDKDVLCMSDETKDNEFDAGNDL